MLFGDWNEKRNEGPNHVRGMSKQTEQELLASLPCDYGWWRIIDLWMGERLSESDWWVDALVCHLSAYAFFLQAAKAIWRVMLKNNSLQHIDVDRNHQCAVL